MTRLRIALLLLAVGIALPSWLIVSRALSGLAFERQVRHEAVASRIFDEMERALSDILAREEARPFETYPVSAALDSVEPDAAPFVLAYFQVDPNGNFRGRHTRTSAADDDESNEVTPAPLETTLRDLFSSPRTRPTEQAKNDLRRNTDDRVAEFELETADPDAIKLDAVEPDAVADAVELDAFAPDASDLAKIEPGSKKASKLAVEPSPELESATAYDVLENLNIAAAQRATRKQKIVVRPRSNLYASADTAAQKEPLTELLDGATKRFASSVESKEIAERWRPSSAAGGRPGDAVQETPPQAPQAPSPPSPTAREPSRARPAVRDDSAPRLRRVGPDDSAPLPRRETHAITQGRTAGGDDNPPAPLGAATAGADRAAATATVRIAIDPMVGRTLPTDPGTLVLYRTVLVGEQGYRQGLLLDLESLGDWLDDQVLAERGLAELAGAVFAAAPPPPRLDSRASLRFAHRFGEPFDALYVALDLEPLPGLGNAEALYGLSAMLVAVTLLGLVAVYRMVSVVVSFAQRRNNFVAAVSHELKTPLTSIRMYAEMLRDGVATDDAKRTEYLGTITDEAERLTRLINNVLEFSRLENDQRAVALVVGQLGPILAEVAEKLRPHATREGFELSVVVPDDLPPVRFDRDALFQILFNLVDNAMKYAARATRKEIVLEALKRDSGAEGVSVRVRDFGPGVPQNHLTHVFEPFYRGEDELVRGTKGTGIGLALVRDLVATMGARVEGSNAEGGGFQVDIAFDAAS